MSDCWICDVFAAIERATGTAIRRGPDLARDPRLKHVEMQLRAARDISLSQKAQIVAEGMRQIGEHATAARISEAMPQIAAAERNTP